MGKYSSESDSSDSDRGRKSASSRRSKRSKGRYPSSSPPSSSSRHRSEQSSSSRHNKKKSRSHRSRSRSKDRYSSSKSRCFEKRGQRSNSSSSNDSKSKKIRSTSNSSSPASTVRDLANDDLLNSTEQLRIKVQKAIQAAAALKAKKAEEAMPQISQSSIDEIECAGFVQKTFTPKNAQDAPIVVDISDSKREDTEIVSYVLLDGEAARVENWARKLFTLRQQARIKIFGEPMIE